MGQQTIPQPAGRRGRPNGRAPTAAPVGPSDPDGTDRSLGWLFHDVRRYYRRAFDRRAKGLGFTPIQWHALAYLSASEGLRQGELADQLGVAPIAVVRLIDRLEAADLVKRRVHPTDRRARTLHLKPAAFAMIERIRAVSRDIQAQATAGFNADELSLFQDFLARARDNLVADDDAQGQSVGDATDTAGRGGDEDIK